MHTHTCTGVWELQWALSTLFQPQKVPELCWLFQPRKVFCELLYLMHTHVYWCLGASVSCQLNSCLRRYLNVMLLRKRPIIFTRFFKLFMRHLTESAQLKLLFESWKVLSDFSRIFWIFSNFICFIYLSQARAHAYRYQRATATCVDPLSASEGIWWVVISVSCPHTCVQVSRSFSELCRPNSSLRRYLGSCYISVMHTHMCTGI